MAKVKITPEIKGIISACYPEYKGRKVFISDNPPQDLDSYWSEGSRNYYSFFNLADGRIFQVGSNHPMFESHNPRFLGELPDGVLLVEHTIFCGKDCGITIFYNPGNLPKLITDN